MNGILLIILILILIWLVIRFFNRNSKNDDYDRGDGHCNRDTDGYNKDFKPISIFRNKKKDADVKKTNIFSRLFESKLSLPFDDKAITWCANFLLVEEKQLRMILSDIASCYKSFRISKRSRGYRIISAPIATLLKLQQTIYQRILLPVNIHPAATGFRPGISIINNVKPHLGKKNVLKTDIKDFFGSIKLHSVIKAFEKIGYPTNISEILAVLCCLNKALPQGAPTSPALSNIIAYLLDKKLADLAHEKGLVYTRYADDLTLSGDIILQDELLPQITEIAQQEGFVLQTKKTRFLGDNKRKIITGISISSGEKLTIPKATKREIRKNVHYVLTKGVVAHQRHLKSTDPAYIKRLMGLLSYWLSIEPNNKYVLNSLTALKKIEKRTR